MDATRESDDAFDVVIVGAGHAGAQTAMSLRQAHFPGSVLLIGDEPDPPYERPPLSKEYLVGERDFDRLLLRPASFWTERNIALRLGRSVVEVRPSEHHVYLDDGSRIAYGRLVWATGGKPRRLNCPGGDLAGVHTLRTRSDVDRLVAGLSGARAIVIIGGGFIGLEAAAACIKLNKSVTVIEAQERLLARVTGVEISAFYADEHRKRGADVRLSADVSHLEGRLGRVSGVRLSDGELIPADLVIVGIGIEPAVEPLIAAGADGGNGIRVDARGLTSLPDIYAVGDCALHANVFAEGREIRLESVQNAADSAALVAQSIVGVDVKSVSVPWFWSHQYDLKLQTVGISAGFDQAVLRGKTVDGAFSVVYLKQGRVIALDCVNSVRDYVQGRALITAGAEVAASAIRDVSVSLKDILSVANDGLVAGPGLRVGTNLG